MSRLIVRLFVLIALALPLTPAFAQVGPMRGASPAPATQAAPEESNSVMRWLAVQQRDAAFKFRRLLIDLRDGGSWLALLTAVGLAFLYGVFHAAGPGHGKMLVISYFLGRDSRLAEGLRMGVRIALTHVASALAIVAALFLLFEGTPAPDFESTREVRLIAYAGIIALGLWFLLEAAERVRKGLAPANCGHDHGQGHGQGHGHGHHHGHGHDHRPRDVWRARLTGWMAGAVPCTGAIIVLVFCAANGLWLTGLLMVSAIALGMAVTMTGLGILTLVARAWVSRWAQRRPRAGLWSLVMALTGPALVTLGGMVLLALTL
jgi:ABC-type nickel/cobalt efflux system permease component RcnA